MIHRDKVVDVSARWSGGSACLDKCEGDRCGPLGMGYPNQHPRCVGLPYPLCYAELVSARWAPQSCDIGAWADWSLQGFHQRDGRIPVRRCVAYEDRRALEDDQGERAVGLFRVAGRLGGRGGLQRQYSANVFDDLLMTWMNLCRLPPQVRIFPTNPQKPSPPYSVSRPWHNEEQQTLWRRTETHVLRRRVLKQAA